VKTIKHLYIHIPFCAKVCPYCAFHVHRGGGDYQREFVDALVEEVGQIKEEYDLQLETIYFGGGTPSLLSPGLFEKICHSLPACLGEKTIEVNPKTVSLTKARCWKEVGLNRISLGAQSFNQGYLKILGRDHTPKDIVCSVEILKEVGFDNLGIDLMFALPNQPREIWLSTLKQALECQPTHLSCYGLTYEEDTPFFKSLAEGVWKKNEEDEIWMFSETEEVLAEAGLPFYEISNFARNGFESNHNQAYWLGKDYLGVGPSAYSTVGHARWQNLRDTREYISGIRSGTSTKTEVERLSPEIKRKERWMFGLRMRNGIAMDELQEFSTVIDKMILEGLLNLESQRVRLSSKGRLVADCIAEYFA